MSNSMFINPILSDSTARSSPPGCNQGEPSALAEQYHLCEEAGGIAGIRFIFPIPDGKGKGISFLEVDLTRIGRRRARSFYLVESRIASVTIDVGVKERRRIVQHMHVSGRQAEMNAGKLGAHCVGA